ncbi:HEAT repeat domain-containing protein [Leptothoe spongobia]|uniref:HEAT repeat domain-containing protein n=1 Tax=Leptothoe spongobia TAU-MAC 1115 TaxID=1967444 RepID=A0A947GMA6_9CYAN|nr:HEAT repeat domain-containing protein [Leptothoe spongobia]MBT9317547.1 HEAT repeat domain-containing protein [Leptothoe spongobia TAU-MAC 1115]
MSAEDYQPPIDQLLAYGRPNIAYSDQWINYVDELGLTTEHIPELVRLASDKELDDDDDVEIYACIHAYRALGQLKAESAIEPLIQLLGDETNDWILEELPEVFAMIGPTCIGPLVDYLTSPEPGSYSKMATARGLQEIAKAHPDYRDDCVQHLSNALARHKQQPPDLNGSLVAKLLRLEATDAVDVIEKAYKEGPMDEMFCGTWARVQIELGLATESDFTPEELHHFMPEWMEAIQHAAQGIRQLPQSKSSIALPTKTAHPTGLTRFGKGDLAAAEQSKSPKPKAGFGSSKNKEKKSKKKKKR